MPRSWLRVVGVVVVAIAAVLGCSSPPPEGETAGDLGAVSSAPAASGLATNGLMPPLPACCPGASCCDPSCRYSDTADPWLEVPPGLVTGPEGISVPSHRVGNPNASACVNQEVTALDAPVAIFYATSRDRPMASATDTCVRTERRCSGWWLWRRCWDECVQRKSRWDEVREGTQQFAQDNALSQSTLGANAVHPFWDSRTERRCRRTCFLGFLFCRTVCDTLTYNDLSCDRNRYELWGARYGQFSGWTGSFMGELWNKSTSPASGNAGHWAQLNAYNRAREYLASNPTASAAVNLVVDDFPNGCGAGDLGAMANSARDAFLGWPSIQTNILSVGLRGVDPPPYRSVYQNGGGVDRYIDPVDDVNGDTRRELTDIRRLSSKRAFIIPLPASGEPINVDTLRFRLRQGGTDYPLYRFASRWDCGWNDGYWVDFPEGVRGRPRVNLCQRTKMWADGALPTGIANYDCMSERSASATYVRTNDFDLSKCQSAQMKPRLLRLDWRSVLPWNTWIQFRLQVAPRQQDLATAPSFFFNATSWTVNAVGWADLTTLPFASDYRFARLSATLVTSSDEFHRYTPTLRSWDLTFTCVDAN